MLYKQITLVGFVLWLLIAIANAGFEKHKAIKLADLLECENIFTVQCVADNGGKKFIDKRLLKGGINNQMRRFLRNATILVEDIPSDYLVASNMAGTRRMFILLDAKEQFKIVQNEKSVIITLDELENKLLKKKKE